MNFRMPLILAGTLVIMGGCAASGGSSSASAPAAPTSGGTALAQGERPRENDMTQAAARHIEQAVESETPEEASAHYAMAAESAQQAIDADLTNPLPYYQLGLAQMGMGDYVGADASLSRAEELRPIYTLETDGIRERAWIDLYQEAAPLVNSGDYEAAIEVFKNADVMFDKRPEVKAYMGQLYVQMGEYDAALVSLREARGIINSDLALEMDSATVALWKETDAELPIYITQALMETQRYGEAAQELQSLLAVEPENMTYLRQLAALYLEMEQPADAQAIYDEMAATGNLTPVEHYAIGVGYYQMENFPAALESFQTASDLSKMDRDALEMWALSVQLAYPAAEGGMEAPAGVLDDMVAGAERWLELDPNNRNAYLILAQTVNRTGDEDRARELIGQVEGLSVMINNIQLQRYSNGGGLVSGSIMNVSMAAGSSVTINFDFYDASGARIGSEQAMVSLPGADASQTFQVDFSTDQPVAGYGYTIAN